MGVALDQIRLDVIYRVPYEKKLTSQSFRVYLLLIQK